MWRFTFRRVKDFTAPLRLCLRHVTATVSLIYISIRSSQMSLGKFDSETEPCCIGASVLKVIQMGFELFAIYQSGP